MRVHLVPLGRGRHELYAEPPEVDEGPPAADAGRLRRWLHAAGEQWRSLVDAARLSTAPGRFARWRDAIICRLAASIEEQRTMWSLRGLTTATTLFPAALDAAAARATLMHLLATAQRFHGQRLVLYLVLFIVSGILFFVPGPNVVAYYLGFQGFGHLQSWRGARRASSAIRWDMEPSDLLAELETLASQPHDLRATRVAQIAAQLDLPHLPAFLERVAT